LKKTLVDLREEKLDEKLRELAANQDWNGVLDTLDQYDTNNERRHQSHRADMDTAIVDRGLEEGECYRVPDMLKLSRCEDWEEIIFSQSPEDLHQLVENAQISQALKDLSPTQKVVLLENFVHNNSTAEIAEALGTGMRNITKHRKIALEQIRAMLENNSGEATVGTVVGVLAAILFPTFFIGWKISERIYPSIKRFVQKAA